MRAERPVEIRAVAVLVEAGLPDQPLEQMAAVAVPEPALEELAVRATALTAGPVELLTVALVLLALN